VQRLGIRSDINFSKFWVMVGQHLSKPPPRSRWAGHTDLAFGYRCAEPTPHTLFVLTPARLLKLA